MSGKILFTSYDDALDMNLDEFEIKLQIVRFTGKGLLRGFVQVPQLSPSERLFKQTMYKWKKLNFTKEEINFLRKGKTGTWFDLYEIAFLKEMGFYNDFNDLDYIKKTNKRNDLVKAYERIKEHLDNGKNIIAICYCENFNRCHRYIIGNELIKEGYKVEIR